MVSVLAGHQYLLEFRKVPFWDKNDLPENLQSTVKLFADDTSLFSTVCEPNISASQLDSDLKKISHWAYKWKMNFNPDLSKQAQEVIFHLHTHLSPLILCQ